MVNDSLLAELKDDVVERPCIQEWIAIFSKFPVVVLIVTQFLVIFTQSTVEVLVTPLTESWYLINDCS